MLPTLIIERTCGIKQKGNQQFSSSASLLQYNNKRDDGRSTFAHILESELPRETSKAKWGQVKVRCEKTNNEGMQRWKFLLVSTSWVLKLIHNHTHAIFYTLPLWSRTKGEGEQLEQQNRKRVPHKQHQDKVPFLSCPVQKNQRPVKRSENGAVVNNRLYVSLHFVIVGLNLFPNGHGAWKSQQLRATRKLHVRRRHHQSSRSSRDFLFRLCDHFRARNFRECARLLRGGSEQSDADSDQLFHHEPGTRRYPPVRSGSSLHAPLHIFRGVDFRAGAVPLGALRSRHQRLHFYADAHVNRHRPIFRDHLPVQTKNEADHVLAHHHGNMGVCFAGHPSIRDLPPLRDERGAVHVWRVMAIRTVSTSVQRLHCRSPVCPSIHHHPLLLHESLLETVRSSEVKAG